jgi:hypothetical protein
MAAKANLLPEVVQQAFAPQLFVHWLSFGDWNFRVLFQTLRARQQFSSIVVLKPPDENRSKSRGASGLFRKILRRHGYESFWGTAREFSSQLDERWKMFEQRKNDADPVTVESKDVLPPKSGRELDDKTWERLLKRIRDDKCTP